MAGFDIDIPRAVLVVMTLAVLGAFIAGGVTSGAAFDSFNPEWDGTSELRSTASDTGSEPVIVQETIRYDEYGQNDIAFVLAPTDQYEDRDIDHVRGFVERGGTLVVAARDSPEAAALLAGVDAEARPQGSVLRDEQQYYRSPALPVATNVSDHPLVAGVESITLNHGTAVEPGDATVLIASSQTAYLDIDGDETLSQNETLAPYPVVTVESIGAGQVLVVGDPSVFINVMQQETANDQFTSALVNGTDNTLVDVSNRGSPPPLIQAQLAIRDSALLQVGVGVGLLTLVGLATRVIGRRPDQGPPRPALEPDELVGGYERLYPDIDSETVRRLTKGLITGRSQSRDND
jgi:hypothetical protein